MSEMRVNAFPAQKPAESATIALPVLNFKDRRLNFGEDGK